MNIKKHLALIAALLLVCTINAQEKQLSATFSYATFNQPKTDKPYVETYLSFDAWNMQFHPIGNGQYRATVDMVIIARKGDSVCFVKKYSLNSPVINDPTATNFNFIDLQRFQLDNGIYTLELSVKDHSVATDPVKVEEKIIVDYQRKQPCLSSVQLMSSAKPTTTENAFSRNGYDMEPYVSAFVPEQVQVLSFYYEIYHIDRELLGKPFLTYAFIEEQETGRRIGNIQNFNRRECSDFVPVYSSLDISKLPSGNYNLVVEVHNRDNQNMMFKKVPFQRSNPSVIYNEVSPYDGTFASLITDENLLNYYLDALYPVASEDEKVAVNKMIARPGLEEKQAFLYKFWTRRNPVNPEKDWVEYRSRIEYVEKNFTYPKTPGIHTDRGRVYLQYGPPDYIRDEKNFVSALHLGSGTAGTRKIQGLDNTGNSFEQVIDNSNNHPSSQGHIYYLPYQLWRYNYMPTDNPNRVFLFWDEFRSGFYQLLNSNAKGEVQDPRWERRLSQQQLGEDVIGEVGEQFNRGY